MRLRTWLKHVFIPHAGNGYAPHSLQRAALFGMFALVLVSFAAANVQSLFWLGSRWMVATVLPAVIISDTNQQRVDGHLAGLAESPLLDAAAQLKAHDMAVHQYFAHFSPTGVSPWHWFNLVGYHYQNAGENLAINFTDSGAIVTAWMNSPEHRANIMSNQYTEIGVGTAAGVYHGYQTVYVVQLFGSPAAMAPARPPTVTQRPVATTNAAGSIATPVAPPAALAHATTATSASAVAAAATTHGALFSDLATTSARAELATGGTTAAAPRPVPFAWRVLTEPQLALELLYALIATFVLISLGLSIAIEWRRQQPYQIVYSVALLALMVGLFYLHTVLVAGITIG